MGWLRRRFVLTAGVLALLALAAGAYLVRGIDSLARTEAERQLLETTRAMSSVVDGDIRRYEAMLAALASSESLARGDFAAFDAVARRQPVGPDAWIVVGDRSGRQLVNTALPPGSALPLGRPPAAMWRALDRGRSHVCDLVRGRIEPRILCVDVPVLVGGRPAYNLSVIFRPRRFQAIIDRQRLDPAAFASILDSSGAIAWRAPNPDRWVGYRASAATLRRLAPADEGVGRSRSFDGQAAVYAYSRGDSGFVFVVGLPEDRLGAGLAWAARSGLPIAAALLLLAMLIAFLAGRRLSTAISRLAEDASSPDAGAWSSRRPSGIPEVDAVADAFARAVGEREAGLERLRENEALLSLFVENAPAAIAMFDRDMRYRAVSRRFVTDLRLGDVPDLIGRSHYELFPEIPAEWRAIHARVLAGEALSAEEDPFPRADGTVDWVRWSMRPWRMADGEIGGAVIFSEVVTDRVEARRAREATEARLRESEARLQLAQEVGGIGTYELRPESGLSVWSPQLYALYGRDPALGPPGPTEWATLVHPEDLQRMSGPLPQDLRAGDAIETEYRVRLRTGGVRWLASRARIFPDDEGRPTRIIGVNIDITALKAADQALRESEGRLRAAVVAAPFPMMLHAEDGEVLEVSRRWLELTGYSRDDIPDHLAWGRLAYPDEPERFARAVAEEFSSDREVAAGEWTVRTKDGGARVWDFYAAPLAPLPDGRRLKLTAAVDVTDRKRWEAHQRLLIDELNHRVKNTLAVVQGLAQQTFRGGDPLQARKAFEGRLAALSAAHNVLTRRSWSHAQLREILEGALAPFAQADDRISLEGADLPLPPKVAVNLSLALHELATNAMKYGALSVPEGRVAVRWRNDDGRLCLAWRESGGPAVRAPDTRGFGTRMIERGLASELGGTVAVDFRPDGLVCEIDAPLPEIDR